jgi:phage-related tail fiber protein
MANTIRIKRRASGANGAPATLENAELAFNEVDNTLYYGKGTGGSGGSATTIEAIGGTGAFVSLTSTQTISGAKTFTGTVSLGSSATATTPDPSDNSTKVATTAFVKGLGLGSGSVTSVGLSLPSIFTVSNSPVTTAGTLTATLASQTANQVFVAPNGSNGSPTFRSLVAADIPTLTAAKISDFDTQVRTNRLDQMTAPVADVSFNNRKITSLADPTQNQDAATKAYVDTVAQGIHTHTSCRLATAAALPTCTYNNGTSGVGATLTATANGALTVDGVSVVVDDRILVKNQANAFENGVYVVTATGSAGAAFILTRSTDMNQDVEFPGSFEFVEEGSTNADNGYVVSTNLPITIGTTGITWTQFSGAGQITAGAGLTKNGNIIDVATASSDRIVVNADSIDLATTGVSANTYKSVTVDTYGRVTSGTNPTTLSGYGITDALSTSSTSSQNIYGQLFMLDNGLSSAGHYLKFDNVSDLTAARTLSIDVNDANRTIGLSGNLTVSANATVSGTNTGDQTITLTGDVTGSGTGSFATTLANSGVTASTYKSVTVNAKGLVTSGTNPTTLAGYGIVDAQALDATLTALAGVSTSANTLIYATGSDTFTTTSFTSFGRSLVDDADASAGRTTLGLGTIATQNSNSVSITGGTIDNITFDGGTF